MTELIQEIYGTIMRNKLRTLLTGLYYWEPETASSMPLRTSRKA